jgi:hypothetical protein
MTTATTRRRRATTRLLGALLAAATALGASAFAAGQLQRPGAGDADESPAAGFDRQSERMETHNLGPVLRQKKPVSK